MPPKTIKVVLFRSGGGFGERSVRTKNVSFCCLADRRSDLDRHAFVARRPGETEDRPWAQFDIDASRAQESMVIVTLLLIYPHATLGPRPRHGRFRK
jgi:hypothetical protein